MAYEYNGCCCRTYCGVVPILLYCCVTAPSPHSSVAGRSGAAVLVRYERVRNGLPEPCPVAALHSAVRGATDSGDLGEQSSLCRVQGRVPPPPPPPLPLIRRTGPVVRGTRPRHQQRPTGTRHQRRPTGTRHQRWPGRRGPDIRCLVVLSSEAESNSADAPACTRRT